MDILSLMYRALSSPAGVELQTSDPEALRQLFYRTRRAERERGNTSFEEISAEVRSANTLWLVRR